MQRLDTLLVKKNIYSSRNRAKMAIKNAMVKVDGKVITKVAFEVSEDAIIETEEFAHLSRAGAKLEQAIKSWQIDLTDSITIDIGASTGGFTALMLKNGASKIYAIDVGVGQLHPSLLNDNRVINLENTNIRYFDFKSISDKIDFISVDVSFISLSYVLPLLSNLVKKGALLVCLIKPQFEVGKALIGKNGIVKSKKAHVLAIKKVKECAEENGLVLTDLINSPITGTKGNREFLALFNAPENTHVLNDSDILKVIDGS